jgi:two-component system OmpR family response regulator
MKTTTDLSVFLVDDDKMFLRSLEHYLQHQLKPAIKIRSFLSGEECLESLYQSPSVIVLDYFLNKDHLGAMNGSQILRKIKQSHPEIPVIVMSGQEEVDVAIETLKSGAFDYVSKKQDVLLKMKSVIRRAIDSIAETRQIKTARIVINIIALIALVILAAIVVDRIFLR